MKGVGGHSTVLVLFYRTMLWLAALLALADAASAAGNPDRQRPHYYLDSPVPPDDQTGGGIPGQTCSVSSVALPDDDVLPAGFTDPIDCEWIGHAEAQLSDAALPLGLNRPDYLVRHLPETGGTHARGPPSSSPAV